MSFKYTYTKEAVLGRLEQEILASSVIVHALDYITSLGNTVDIYFKAELSSEEETELDAIVAAHVPTPLPDDHTLVLLDEKRSTDDIPVLQIIKSYHDSSKSFTTPDFTDRKSWFFDRTRVTDEVMSTSDDTIYSSTRTPTAGWNHDWLRWDLIPNHIRQTETDIVPVVKKNDEVVSSGFTIDYTNGTVTFDSANQPTDVIKVSYSYGNSSRMDLTANAGKKLFVDYVETQFSVGCTIPSTAKFVFQSIYNGPAIPAYGIPENTDVILRSYEYYNAKDFLNESTQAYVVEPFMELTAKVNILPWNYLTGHTIKPAGDTTTDLSKNEFNKLRIQLVDINGGPDPILSSAEIATGTVYCRVHDVTW